MNNEYIEIYESKVTNALVRVKNEPNIELLARTVIMIAEDYMVKKEEVI